MKHLDIIIHGKVQGVYFRASAKAVADQLGIKGTARNRADGTVFIEAEGDDFALGLFKEFCEKGPDDAVVQHIEIREGALQQHKNFEILRR